MGDIVQCLFLVGLACPNVENFAVGVGKSLVMACSWWWVWDGVSVVRDSAGWPGTTVVVAPDHPTTRVNQQWWLATS